ncbi:MAG: adenine phosphoribosyltransferase [Nitrospirae bacterium]|nr:MAG: adenine phosphoribosyltransferase [Nitrospirota bacterium]
MDDSVSQRLLAALRDVPDFPKPGIVFKDITPLLGHGETFALAIDTLAERYRPMGLDRVVVVESRGFLFGAPLAHALGCGLALVRKPGKLPAATHREDYDLEYGSDALEIHQDALEPGDRVVVVDDVIATGGTLAATVRLVERLEAQVVEIAALAELTFLNGRDRLAPHPVHTLIQL